MRPALAEVFEWWAPVITVLRVGVASEPSLICRGGASSNFAAGRGVGQSGHGDRTRRSSRMRCWASRGSLQALRTRSCPRRAADNGAHLAEERRQGGFTTVVSTSCISAISHFDLCAKHGKLIVAVIRRVGQAPEGARPSDQFLRMIGPWCSRPFRRGRWLGFVRYITDQPLRSSSSGPCPLRRMTTASTAERAASTMARSFSELIGRAGLLQGLTDARLFTAGR